MLPLIMAACGAVGAVVGVVTTQAAKEQDKQAIKRYEKVNAELINSRDKLQQRHYELADRSKQQINELNLKLVESEMEKDVVYLALELYQELMGLREDIDINPSFEVLVEFHKAIMLTNYVLKQLDRRLVPVTQDYFNRTLTRIDERDNLSKKQLFGFMSVLMNPQEDTISSLLGEVQNEMFSERNTEMKQKYITVDQPCTIEPDNIDYHKIQDDNQWNQAQNTCYQETLTRVTEIVIEQLEVDKHQVTEDASFANDLGADSLDTVELVMAFEEEFNLEIPDEIAEQVETVGKAVELIARECGNHGNLWEEVSQNKNEISQDESTKADKKEVINSIFDEVKDWGNRGQKLFDLDYYEEAITCYKKAVSVESNNNKYWEMLARSSSMLERYEQALESIEKAIYLDQENDEHWCSRGWILIGLKRFEEALESVEKAISLDQENDEHWCLQGRFLTYLDRDEEALLSIKKAIYLN